MEYEDKMLILIFAILCGVVAVLVVIDYGYLEPSRVVVGTVESVDFEDGGFLGTDRTIVILESGKRLVFHHDVQGLEIGSTYKFTYRGHILLKYTKTEVSR